MAQGASEQDAIAKASFFGALFLPQSSSRVDRSPEGLQSAQLTLQQEHTREILKDAATASCARVTDEARIDIGAGGEEGVDNRAHLTIMVPLPMSKSMQGALVTGE